MKILTTKILPLLVAVVPLTGAYASDGSEEACAQEFGLTVAQYREMTAQYSQFSSVHDQHLADFDQHELERVTALSAADLPSVELAPQSVLSSASVQEFADVDRAEQARLEAEAEEAWLLKQIADAQASDAKALERQQQAFEQAKASYSTWTSSAPLAEDVQTRLDELRNLECVKNLQQEILATASAEERPGAQANLDETMRQIGRLHFSSRTLAHALTGHVEEDPHHIARLTGLNTFLKDDE